MACHQLLRYFEILVKPACFEKTAEDVWLWVFHKKEVKGWKGMILTFRFHLPKTFVFRGEMKAFAATNIIVLLKSTAKWHRYMTS